jgi:hypothetical protein
MTTMEPFVPHPDDDETVAAADPGAGAPEPAAGFGVEGEEPDRAGSNGAGSDPAGSDPAEFDLAPGGAADLPDTPFRTPAPPDRRD